MDHFRMHEIADEPIPFESPFNGFSNSIGSSGISCILKWLRLKINKLVNKIKRWCFILELQNLNLNFPFLNFSFA